VLRVEKDGEEMEDVVIDGLVKDTRWKEVRLQVKLEPLTMSRADDVIVTATSLAQVIGQRSLCSTRDMPTTAEMHSVIKCSYETKR
jgi:hypothetical protein